MSATQFNDFDKSNPTVWKLFKQFTHDYVKSQLDRGIPKKSIRISHWLIVARIRWESKINTVDYNSSFKINNNYTAHYARKFIKQFPKLSHLFQIRELKNTAV